MSAFDSVPLKYCGVLDVDAAEMCIRDSIGTTKKQIRKILTLECGIYALISTLLIMTFGNAFLMLVADAVPHMANYAEMCIRDSSFSVHRTTSIIL